MDNISCGINNLRKNIDCLEAEISRFYDKVNKMQRALEHNDGIIYNIYSFQVTKKILSYISQGIEENSALFLAYDDYSEFLSKRDIDLIWKCARAQKKGLNMYGRVYTVKTMRKAGYTITDIANTLCISPTSVRKLIKCACVM